MCFDLLKQELSPDDNQNLFRDYEDVQVLAMLFMTVQPIGHFRNAKGNWSRNVPLQLFLGSLLGTRRSAIGHFFLVLSNNPRSLCASLLDPVFLSLLNFRIFRQNSISPVFLLFNFQSVSGHFPYLTLPKPVMPLNK